MTARADRRLEGAPTLVTLRALGLGDFLTAIPAYRALADAFPGHRRVLAAPRALAPLARLCGAIDQIVHTPDLVPLDPSLLRPAVAVDLHGRGPASHRLLADLVPGRLLTFADPATPTPANRSGPLWCDDEHEVRRWCRMLGAHGIASDPSRLDLQPPPVRVPAWAQGATLVHPGAKDPARRWPVDRFAEIAAAEAGAGRQVVVTAGPGERDLAGAVVAMASARAAVLGDVSPDAWHLAEPSGLDHLAGLVASAGRVVCGDTGVAHLATSLRTPSVVLFGPVPPAWWGPPKDRWWHVALWAGRLGDPHGAAVDAGLVEIGVADVLLALARLPDRAPGPPGAALRPAGMHLAGRSCAHVSRRPGPAGKTAASTPTLPPRR